MDVLQRAQSFVAAMDSLSTQTLKLLLLGTETLEVWGHALVPLRDSSSVLNERVAGLLTRLISSSWEHLFTIAEALQSQQRAGPSHSNAWMQRALCASIVMSATVDSTYLPLVEDILAFINEHQLGNDDEFIFVGLRAVEQSLRAGGDEASLASFSRNLECMLALQTKLTHAAPFFTAALSTTCQLLSLLSEENAEDSLELPYLQTLVDRKHLVHAAEFAAAGFLPEAAFDSFYIMWVRRYCEAHGTSLLPRRVLRLVNNVLHRGDERMLLAATAVVAAQALNNVERNQTAIDSLVGELQSATKGDLVQLSMVLQTPVLTLNAPQRLLQRSKHSTKDRPRSVKCPVRCMTSLPPQSNLTLSAKNTSRGKV